MTDRQQTIAVSDTGMLHIFVQRRDRLPHGGHWWLGHTPLYRALIKAAHKAGIHQAAAHHTHLGFSEGSKPQDENPEIPNPHLTMRVDLIATRAELEAFCITHRSLLTGKAIVFQPLERWTLTAETRR